MLNVERSGNLEALHTQTQGSHRLGVVGVRITSPLSTFNIQLSTILHALAYHHFSDFCV